MTSQPKRTTTSSQDLLMARQPIYDGLGQLYGYELLFRNADGLSAETFGGDKATSQVVVNLCTSINAQIDTFKLPLFINLSADFLASEAFLPINPEVVVLELPANTEASDSLLLTLAELTKKGYRLAMSCGQNQIADIAFFPFLDFMKIEVQSISENELRSLLATLAAYPFQLVAEKVETPALYRQCQAMGFSLFQGYFLARPDQVYGTAVQPSTQGLMQVMRRIQQVDSSMDQVSEAVSREPRLVYQVLRILNSPACKLHRKIETIREALVLLGMNQLKKWTMLIMLASSGEEKVELVRILLTRARACERYAEMRRLPSPEHYFMTGLLSGIEMLLEADRDSLLAQINVSEDVVAALTSGDGNMGQALNCVGLIENHQWDGLNSLPFETYQDIFEAYHQAGVWAHEMIELIYQ